MEWKHEWDCTHVRKCQVVFRCGLLWTSSVLATCGLAGLTRMQRVGLNMTHHRDDLNLP
ncbi:hypothetical protein BDV40DRAFT_258655 [Aspergillus tamarii]|uniref:Uncharacterized protein n=1 Tax=Aspergillus tamarii TaxID=41984 RepID=A0A5N6V3D5_ASPTM|nr:hypothetical protein BDV40DRAFT_258655 [Aspergillus tamarii]